MAKFNKDLCFGIMTLIGATLIHHTYGFLYVTGKWIYDFRIRIGDLIPYLQGYFNISSGVTTFFTSAIFSCEALSTPLGALLSLKIGYIWSTILSILLSRSELLLRIVNAGNILNGDIIFFGYISLKSGNI